MTNHVHLLLAPSDVRGIGKLMKRLAGRLTRHHNALEGRTGSLWEGRYKSSLVDTDAYLLACCRYIELNPMTAQAESYPGQVAGTALLKRNLSCSTLIPATFPLPTHSSNVTSAIALSFMPRFLPANGSLLERHFSAGS
jgi:hypothetical protein